MTLSNLFGFRYLRMIDFRPGNVKWILEGRNEGLVIGSNGRRLISRRYYLIIA